MMARGSGLLPYVLFFLAPFSLAAQGPDVGRNGVFNAASATPLALSGGEIARGALLAVTGVRLGTDAAGTAVRLAGSWGAMPLTLVSVSPTRIEARVPPAVPLGPATLTVTASGQSSRAVPVRVVAAQFGAYSRIRNLSPWGARTANSPNQAAAPGEAVVLEGTGLGSATAPQVFIGGKRGTLVSVRRGTTGKAADEIAVRRALLRECPQPSPEQWLAVTPQRTVDLLASFQHAVIHELLTRAASAAETIDARTLIVSGGVACNSGLRKAAAASSLPYPVYFPTPGLSTDNAAMIGAAAFPKLARGEFANLDIAAQANLALA